MVFLHPVFHLRVENEQHFLSSQQNREGVAFYYRLEVAIADQSTTFFLFCFLQFTLDIDKYLLYSFFCRRLENNIQIIFQPSFTVGMSGLNGVGLLDHLLQSRIASSFLFSNGSSASFNYCSPMVWFHLNYCFTFKWEFVISG